MQEYIRELKKYLEILNVNRAVSLGRITDVRWSPCGYKQAG